MREGPQHYVAALLLSLAGGYVVGALAVWIAKLFGG
jgi:hypothetical protein